MPKPGHHSFQLTPQPYLMEKRCIRRLWIIYATVNTLSVLAAFATFAAWTFAIVRFNLLDDRNKIESMVGLVTFLLLPMLAFQVDFRASRLLAHRFGMLSRSEAAARVEGLRRWPSEWLEDVPSQQVPELISPEKPDLST